MVEIVRVTRTNYHLFEDMVYWRMKGVELTESEKAAHRKIDSAEKLKELEHPGFYSYGGLSDGRFVGWISMMYTPKIGPRWKQGMLYVDEIWVAPQYRHKGIAKRLMQKAFECQKETGAVEVRLYVGTGNTAALRLYKSCGLHEEGPAIYMKSAAA